MFFLRMSKQSSSLYARVEKIRARKKELKGRVLILAHHYQDESVYQFADLTGDSLKLARQAAEAGKFLYIIF